MKERERNSVIESKYKEREQVAYKVRERQSERMKEREKQVVIKRKYKEDERWRGEDLKMSAPIKFYHHINCYIDFLC